MQLNQIQFAGFAGGDAKTFTTKSGQEIVNINLCHTHKNKAGNEFSTWVQAVCTDWRASIAKTIRKGDNVYVTGTLSVNKSSNNGKEYFNVQILVNSLMVGMPRIKETAVNNNDQINFQPADYSNQTHFEGSLDDVPF